MSSTTDTTDNPTVAQPDTHPATEPVQDSAAPGQVNQMPESTASVDSTGASESSTQPSITSDTSRSDGPLSTLAQKAADTHLGRAASQKIPESARPTIDRASRVLTQVDEHLIAAKETMETDEGRRVVKSGREFVSSVLAFLNMICLGLLSSAEKKLGLEPSDESCPQRAVKLCGESAKRLRACAETREKQVDGSLEAWIYVYLRQAMDLTSVAFKSSLKGLSQFSGPGKEYVTPTADRFISVLPEDMQKAVREGKGPIQALRNGLGLKACSSSEADCTETSPEATTTGSRMKAD